MVSASEQRGGDGRHSARGNQCGLGAFDGGQLLAQGVVVGRVVEPDVALVVIADVAVHVERGRLEDRHGDRPGDARFGFAGVNEFRVDGAGLVIQGSFSFLVPFPI